MMLFDLGWGKDKGWTSSQACSGVEMWIDFLCGWKSVLGICKQAKWYAHLLAVDFGPSKASEILIHFSRGTEKRPQREPEAFALLRVPPDYLRFPFLVPKTTPRPLPGLLSGSPYTPLVSRPASVRLSVLSRAAPPERGSSFGVGPIGRVPHRLPCAKGECGSLAMKTGHSRSLVTRKKTKTNL